MIYLPFCSIFQPHRLTWCSCIHLKPFAAPPRSLFKKKNGCLLSPLLTFILVLCLLAQQSTVLVNLTHRCPANPSLYTAGLNNVPLLSFPSDHLFHPGWSGQPGPVLPFVLLLSLFFIFPAHLCPSGLPQTFSRYISSWWCAHIGIRILSGVHQCQGVRIQPERLCCHCGTIITSAVRQAAAHPHTCVCRHI